MLDQQYQRIERLGLDGKGSTVAHQQVAFRIDAEPVELVETNPVGCTLSPAEKR
ncbi:MAG TPA: hypothetical protein VH458_06885 [Vicinamibacterales bacterium]